MTTDSDTGPDWFGKTAEEVLAAIGAREESWAAVPGYSRYEWSDKGRTRSFNGRTRSLDGILRHRVNNSGYELVNVRNDEGRMMTVTPHKMVLLAHHPAFRGLAAFPAGLETRHGPAGTLCNAYPENLWPGTKPENEADKIGPEGPPVKFRCKNAPRCRNWVLHKDRRCGDCAEEVGRQAAALLEAGMNLRDAAKVFGYTRGDWTYRLAVKYGGYTGTKEEAQARRPPLGQRALLRFRRRSMLRHAAAGDAVRRPDGSDAA